MGKVWRLGEDIDTDIIIPTEYLALESIEEMKTYAFSPLRSALASSIQAGDYLVAGKNFGCGSSREQAPEVIKALGITCVIAESFARIFYRNALNNGLRLIEAPELARKLKEGDVLNWDGKKIIYEDEVYEVPQLPEELECILESGGLVAYWKKQNQES